MRAGAGEPQELMLDWPDFHPGIDAELRENLQPSKMTL
jgi:hypothetical protein